MTLAEAFRIGAVESIPSDRLQEIGTQISDVFLGETEAYKIYRRTPTFYGDLASPEFRIAFYREDFSWNHRLSPHIYLELVPVAFRDATWRIVPEGQAEDFYIRMRRFKEENILSRRILDGRAEEVRAANIVHEYLSRTATLTREKRSSVKAFGRSWQSLLLDRADDLEAFCALAVPVLPEALRKRAVASVRRISETHPYVTGFSSMNLKAGIDLHADNVLIDEAVGFIDVLLVHERWRVIDPHFDLSRLAMDLEALMGDTAAADLYIAVDAALEPPPPEVRYMYELSAAMIKGAYNVLVGRNRLVDPYVNIIEDRTARLEKRPR